MNTYHALGSQRAVEARAIEHELEHVFALLCDRRIEGEERVKLEHRGSQLRAQYRELTLKRSNDDGQSGS